MPAPSPRPRPAAALFEEGYRRREPGGPGLSVGTAAREAEESSESPGQLKSGRARPETWTLEELGSYWLPARAARLRTAKRRRPGRAQAGRRRRVAANSVTPRWRHSREWDGAALKRPPARSHTHRRDCGTLHGSRRRLRDGHAPGAASEFRRAASRLLLPSRRCPGFGAGFRRPAPPCFRRSARTGGNGGVTGPGAT